MSVASLAVQVFPNLGVLFSSHEHSFHLEGRQSPMAWLWSSLSGGLVGQDSLDGSPKTYTRVRGRS